MATGGEESELTSSTPTRSSGKRKAAAVKKWRNQKNVGGAGKKKLEVFLPGVVKCFTHRTTSRVWVFLDM